MMTFLRKKLILSVFLSLIFPLNVNAEKINLAKEVNLLELSKKYPICKNKLYRDDCYGIKRGKDFSIEGYWKKNRLWEGIRRDEIANVISYKYIDGIKYPLSECELNIFGWYSASFLSIPSIQEWIMAGPATAGALIAFTGVIGTYIFMTVIIFIGTVSIFKVDMKPKMQNLRILAFS